jgi:hypothetical protein
VNEHQQELSMQMNDISREYDIFEQDLNKKMHEHPLLSLIDQWEQESHNKIQQIAGQARIDLEELIDRSTKNLEASLKQITNELQSSQHSEDYTESDLESWTNQLKEFRNELERPMAMNVIVDDDKESVIRLIKVSKTLDSRAINRSIDTSDQIDRNLSKANERIAEGFAQMTQKSLLSENGLLARCLDQGPSAIYGIQSYSSGIHSIRFRIEQISKPNMFFGITTQHQIHSEPSCSAPSTNGWWNLANCVKDGILTRNNPTITIQTGDEVTLVLGCDHEQIHFHHHRTQNNNTMAIDLQKCPFPWKILIALTTQGDCVRLLDSGDSS